MAKRIVMTMFCLNFEMPKSLDKSVYQRAQRTLRSKRFHEGLRKSVEDVLRRYPSLRHVRFSID
jgi:hypothetical protein